MHVGCVELWQQAALSLCTHYQGIVGVKSAMSEGRDQCKSTGLPSWLRMQVAICGCPKG